MSTRRLSRLARIAVACMAIGWSSAGTAMAAPTSGHIAPGWSHFTVSPPGKPGEGYVPGDAPGIGFITGVTGAEIGIDAGGEAIAAWERYRTPASAIQASTRLPGGTWSAPVDIGEGTEVRLAVGASGAAIAVWEHPVDGLTVLESSYRTPDGSWSGPVGLGPDAGSAADPEVAIGPSGEAAVVWERELGRAMSLESAFRDPLGDWSMQDLPGKPSAQAAVPQIAIGPTGQAIAAWVRVRHGRSAVESATRAPGGPWTKAVRLSARGEGPYALVPSIAVDATGEAVAAWSIEQGVGRHARATIFSASRPAGAGWSAPVRVGRERGEVEGVELALAPDGRAAMAWERERHFHYALESAFRSASGKWSPREPIRHVADDGNPRVAIDAAGEAVLVFVALHTDRRTQRETDSVESAFHQPGGGWSVPRTVARDRDPIYDPEVVLSPAGEEVAIWEVWDYHIEEELIDQIYRGASHPKF
jgi:hypothetical protein